MHVSMAKLKNYGAFVGKTPEGQCKLSQQGVITLAFDPRDFGTAFAGRTLQSNKAYKSIIITLGT